MNEKKYDARSFQKCEVSDNLKPENRNTEEDHKKAEEIAEKIRNIFIDETPNKDFMLMFVVISPSGNYVQAIGRAIENNVLSGLSLLTQEMFKGMSGYPSEDNLDDFFDSIFGPSEKEEEPITH